MAFVNEIIPEREKSSFKFPVSTRKDGSKPTLYMWTIDRDRNAFLVHTKSQGGSYEGTPEEKHYVLSLNGSLISFVGTTDMSGTLNEGYVLTWHIRELAIPSNLNERIQEVLALIREALDAMGWLYDRSRIAAVNVDFNLSSAI